MDAHRYWRIARLSARGDASNLTLSEARLFNAAALLTGGLVPAASMPPITGALADLVDGSAAQAVTWGRLDIPRLTLTWDFTTPVEVTNIGFGSGTAKAEFALTAELEFSDNAVDWAFFRAFSPPAWPGASAFTTSSKNESRWDRVNLPSASKVSLDGKTASPSAGTTVAGATYHSTGKRQFEISTIEAAQASLGKTMYLQVGVGPLEQTNGNLSGNANSYSVGTTNPGSSYFLGVNTAFPTFGPGQVVGVVADFDTGKLEFFYDGVLAGVATATGLLGKRMSPRVGDTAGWAGREVQVVLEVETMAYPVAGALPWGGAESMTLNAFEVTRMQSVGPANDRVVLAGVPASGTSTPVSVNVATMGDWLDPGLGRVRGTVKLTGTPSNTPVRRKVRLIREFDNLLIREVWSNPVTGVYDFQNVRMDYVYTVLSYDYTGLNRAVVADGQIPELMQ
jgi:hypothetical protein